MALDTIKGITEVNGEEIVVMDELREKYPERFIEGGQMDWEWFETTIRPNKFIYLRQDKNSISFTLQKGPIKEVGKNGCQIDDMIAFSKLVLEQLNKQFPCRENAVAITKMDEALMWLEKRKKDREARGVEGTYKK
jgi:hypothetical protein